MQYIRARAERWWMQAQKGNKKFKAARQRWKRNQKVSGYSIRRHREAFKRAAELRVKATSAELKLKSVLDGHHVKYIFQHVIFLSETAYRIADFYLPDHRIIIELDGGYHESEETKEYDQSKDARTKIKVLRLKNDQVFHPDFFQISISSLKKIEKIEPCPSPPKKKKVIVTRYNPSHDRTPFALSSGFSLQQMKDMKMI